jgi:hypothetical protein
MAGEFGARFGGVGDRCADWWGVVFDALVRRTGREVFDERAADYANPVSDGAVASSTEQDPDVSTNTASARRHHVHRDVTFLLLFSMREA